MTNPIKNHGRLQEKALTHTVVQTGAVTFLVTSGSSGEQYWVTLRKNGQPCAGCTCPRQKYIGTLRNGGQNFCSHVQAAIKFVLAEEGFAITVRPAHVPVDHLHRKTIALGLGDNVVITARRDVNPDRKLRTQLEDDRSFSERLEAVVRLNSGLAGLTPEEAVEAVGQEYEYA